MNEADVKSIFLTNVFAFILLLRFKINNFASIFSKNC